MEQCENNRLEGSGRQTVSAFLRGIGRPQVSIQLIGPVFSPKYEIRAPYATGSDSSSCGQVLPSIVNMNQVEIAPQNEFRKGILSVSVSGAPLYFKLSKPL